MYIELKNIEGLFGETIKDAAIKAINIAVILNIIVMLNPDHWKKKV